MLHQGGWVEGKFCHKNLPGAVTQLSGGARLAAAPLLVLCRIDDAQ